MHADRTIPELPTLEAGIHLLETDERPHGPLHALVLDHVLREGGPADWIDAKERATTRPLARLAPDPRVLDRIRVARAFTAFQQYALVETVSERAARQEPSLVVAPALDAFYREDDVPREEGREMLVRTLAALAGVARQRDRPVLVTRTHDDEFAAPIERAAVETIRCERTAMGPRFVGEAFETLVYPAERGFVQTTLAFWERVLAERRAAVATNDSPEVIARGAH